MPGPALMLMDYQEALCRQDGALGRAGAGAEVVRRRVLEAAVVVLEQFRGRGLPRIHVRVAFDEDYTRMTSASPRFAAIREQRMLLESDPGSAICPELEPQAGELVVTKGCVSPFVGTSLPQALIALAPTELVLGGVVTNHVVESTARTAADSGYRVTVLEDLCAAVDERSHAFAVEQTLPAYGRVVRSADYVRDL